MSGHDRRSGNAFGGIVVSTFISGNTRMRLDFLEFDVGERVEEVKVIQ